MARRSPSKTKAEAQTEAPEATEEANVTATDTEQVEVEETPEESTPDANEAPDEAASEESKPVVDLTAFQNAAQAAVSDADESTGTVPSEPLDKVLTEYRNLDGIKAKNQAKGWLGDNMKSAMGAMNIVEARAWLQLQDSMSAGGGKAAGEKQPADPTEAAVQRIVTLQLARDLVVLPDGVAEDLDDRVLASLNENRELAESYVAWLQADESDRGDEPEVSGFVKNAAKLALGRAAKAGGRASSGGGSFTGERRDIGKHILEAFEEVPVGNFLTIAEIRKHRSSEYGDNPPSAGAISARLFPKKTDGSIGESSMVEFGIQPDTNEKGNKGARKTAEAEAA